MKLSEQFALLLCENSQNERKVHAFVKEYPGIIVGLFNEAWNFYACKPEFKVGTDFRSDFLLLSADSARWHATFIELKGANVPLFARDGRESKALQMARKQICDWRNYVHSYEQAIRHEFAKLLNNMDVDVPAQNSMLGTSVGADTELESVRTCISYRFLVVIARSMTLSREERNRYTSSNHSEDIVTYDRFLNYIKQKEGNQHVSDVKGCLREGSNISEYRQYFRQHGTSGRR
jgi:hypothetical protein